MMISLHCINVDFPKSGFTKFVLKSDTLIATPLHVQYICERPADIYIPIFAIAPEAERL